jgi:hypothetical protein
VSAGTRRVLAQWLRRLGRDDAFRQFVDSKKFRNPDTENEVEFDSLPKEEQARILRQWKDRDKQPEKERKSPRGVLPVDKKQARARAKEMAERLTGLNYRDRDGSLYEDKLKPWPIDMGKITVRDVKGKEHHLPITVKLGVPHPDAWKMGRSLVTGGAATFGHYEDEPDGHGFPVGVEIKINRYKTPNQLAKAQSLLEEEIYNVMIHELTHAQDVDETLAQKNKRQKKHDDKDPHVYYNLPHEVRAFTQQVADEIEHRLDLNYGKDEDPWFPDDADLLRSFLDQSTTWSRVKKYMTPANRKKVLSSAYSAVEEYTKRQKSKKKVARAWLKRLTRA